MKDRFFNVFKKYDYDELPIGDIFVQAEYNDILIGLYDALEGETPIGDIEYIEETNHPFFDYEVKSDKGLFLLKEVD